MILLRGILVTIGLLLLWQGIVILFHLPPYILPTPLQVFTKLYLRAPLILHESIITFTETVLGLALGVIFGAIAAMIMGFFRSLSLWILPILIVSQALPTFAIAPLLVMWFGYGITAKIVMIILMVFFPVTSAFYDGLRRTNIHWLDLAKTMNAKKWRVFSFIRIPAALPALASGIRLATVAAPMGAIVGEWVGASQGLGFLMLNANARMQIDLMFAALFAIIVFSLALYFIVNRLLQCLIPWHTER